MTPTLKWHISFLLYFGGGRIDLCLNFEKLFTDKAIIVIAQGLFITLSPLRIRALLMSYYLISFESDYLKNLT